MASVIEQAQEDVKDKIRLEEAMVEDLESLNTEILLAFVLAFGTSGNLPDLSLFEEKLDLLLLDHSGRAAGVFSQRVSSTLPEELQSTEGEKTAVIAALSAFFLLRAADQARLIMQTTRDDLEVAMFNSEQIALSEAAQGNTLSQQEKAVIAGAVAARALKARKGTIAITETQTAAEASKATEGAILAGQPPPVTVGSTVTTGITKEWVTMRDSRVRQSPFNHKAADRQKVDMNDVFIVSGQQMRWPGDIALGASLGNVINCRCSSIVDNADLIAKRKV